MCSNLIITYTLSTQEAIQQTLFGSRKRESLCLCVWREEDKDELISLHCFRNWPKENGDIHVHNLKAHNHRGSGWVSELEETLLQVIEVAFTTISGRGKKWQNELASITRLLIPHLFQALSQTRGHTMMYTVDRGKWQNELCFNCRVSNPALHLFQAFHNTT